MQIVFRMAVTAACKILITKHLPKALPRPRGTLLFPGEGQSWQVAQGEPGIKWFYSPHLENPVINTQAKPSVCYILIFLSSFVNLKPICPSSNSSLRAATCTRLTEGWNCSSQPAGCKPPLPTGLFSLQSELIKQQRRKMAQKPQDQ